LGGCETGQAKLTKGYHLPARYIIHAVGPIWQGGNRGEAELLASCYRVSLQLASAYGLRRIAFPAIGCGVYGYPIEEAAQIAVKEVHVFLANDNHIETVYLTCFGNDIYAAYQQALQQLCSS
jgi:O-acetyl-ADP-ribose deacetylase (regulator of RNase III)